MNTLEVTYADKAGRLTEGSPDKVKIKELEQGVAKSAKVYVNEELSYDELDSDTIEEIIEGKYDILVLSGSIYNVCLRESTLLSFFQLGDDGVIYEMFYYYADDIWNYSDKTLQINILQHNLGNTGDVLTLDDATNPTWKAPKKLYFHPISAEISQGGNTIGRMSLTLINNSDTKINNMADLLTLVRSWGLSAVYLNVSGGLYTGTEDIVLSVLRISDNSALFYGYDVTNHGASSSNSVTNFTFSNWSDAVNQIL